MLTRGLILFLSAILIIACSETDLAIPDRHSMGLSQPLIEIYAPEGDMVLPAGEPFTVDYAIFRSPNGHHVKIRIDNKKPQIVVRLRGKHRVRGLAAGTHSIRITEYTKDNVETGGDITLSVTMVDMPQPDSPP